MKTAFLIVTGFLIAVAQSLGATNDAASTLQKGLFEEEANQNLNAAIQAYQAVANQFEKDRKLAATAIFRLGECYRKQGATNEAVTQYEKVLRDFSDQPQLVNLSRQQLRGFGGAPNLTTGSEPIVNTTSSAQTELLMLDSQLAEMKKLSKEQARITVQQSFPNPVLTSLMQKLAEAQQNLTALEKEYGPQHADVLKTVELIKTVNTQIDAQIEGTMRGLEIKRAALKKASETLQAQVDGRPAPRRDEIVDLTPTEADEVKRIQAMIKDSPDLINAKDPTGNTPLMGAAERGQLIVARFLLENGADLEAKNSAGDTALHKAARAGHKAMVELLLNNNAAIQSLNHERMTPLHLAAANGFRSVAEILLLRGADPNARTWSGTTPLSLAVLNSFRSVAELLLAHAADVNAKTSDVRDKDKMKYTGTPLVIAVARGDQAMVALLLTNKADVAVTDENGFTPLHLAGPGVAQELLSHGADVNAKGTGKETRGWTPLHAAVNNNAKDEVALLLKNKADPNARIGTVYGEGGEDYTPLLMATARVEPEIVELLLAANADPNLGNRTRTPIINALNNEKPDARLQMVKSLLSHGAQANVRTAEGATPLIVAVGRHDLDVVSALLAGGAGVNAQDRDGRCGLHWTVLRGTQSDAAGIGKMLLDAGANPNLRDREGSSPLYLAVLNNRPDLVELLLANKADPNLQNNQGQTPLDRAKTLLSNSYSPGFGVPGPRPVMIPGQPGVVAAEAPASPASIAEMLRQHGAMDDLPRGNQIIVSRPAANYSAVVFTKAPEDANQYTLFDLLAAQYGLPKSDVEALQLFNPFARSTFHTEAARNPLGYPDLAHVRIRRLGPDRKRWQEHIVDAAAALQSEDCSANVPLQWGDVVEIPETDHVLNELWGGLSTEEQAALIKCLNRTVEVSINGRSTNLTLTALLLTKGPAIVASSPNFQLEPMLRDSKLLLASSDLSRVKAVRKDLATGQEKAWVLDCSNPNNRPNFWLLDGDKIEVPERKTPSGAAAYPGIPSPPRGLNSPGPLPPRSIPNRTMPGVPASQAAGALPRFPAPPAPLSYNQSSQPQLEDADIPQKPGTPLAIPARTLRVPAVSPSETPPANNADALVYSWIPNDIRLIQAGYKQDTSAKPRVGENWEERETADIAGRGGAAAVWTGKEMIVFGGEGMGVSFDDGARYDFAGNSWLVLPRENAPSSRTGCSAVWSGKEMLVWGGFGGKMGDDTNRNDGSRFNLADNTWKPMTTKGAPEARFDHSAVWSGKEMLVWGGYTDSHARYGGCFVPAQLGTGGRYNPAKDSWSAITTKDAPAPRVANGVVWTGKEMIIWGGATATKALGNGARYNPSKDTWKPVNEKGAPGPRINPVVLWTGKEMIVWGGASREVGSLSVCYRDGARYNPDTDSWTPMSQTGGPKGRVQCAVVWTGTAMILWGGVNDGEARGVSDSNRFVSTGALYNPATDTWTTITNTGTPSPRVTTGVAANGGLLLFGGYNGIHLNDTWFFSPNETLYPYAKK